MRKQNSSQVKMFLITGVCARIMRFFGYFGIFLDFRLFYALLYRGTIHLSGLKIF